MSGVTRRIRFSRDTAADATPVIVEVLAALRGKRNSRLVFERGTYHFFPCRAPEFLCFTSNNDSGLKRVAFPVCGFHELTIDGNGSTFVFHGEISPLVVAGSGEIILRSFSVDWADPRIAQADICGAGKGYIDIRTPTVGSRWRLAPGGFLMLQGEGWEAPVRGLLEINPHTKAPAYASGDHCGAPWHSHFSFHRRSADVLRVRNAFTHRPTEGNVLLLLAYDRKNPGIFITDSHDIAIENVHIFHSPAMAVIAQRTKNISVRRSAVRIRPGSRRLFSAGADATHFVNCRGVVEIRDSVFEHMLDDASNVHGIYLKVESLTGTRGLLARLVHPQQHGVSLFAPGDQVALVRRGTLQSIATATVVSVQRINTELLSLEFDSSVPLSLSTGDALENLSWTPDMVVCGCTCRRNRARALLVQTPGRVRISDNLFSPGGSAIQMGAEAQFWFESGAVRDVVIERNRFVDCNVGPWGAAVIDIAPGTHPAPDSPRFHRSIVIRNNLFRTFDSALVFARDVDGLTFEGNRFERTRTYRDMHPGAAHVRLEYCSNVRLSQGCGWSEPLRVDSRHCG